MSNHFPIIPGLYGFGTDTRAAYGAKHDPVICVVNSLRTTGGSPVWDPSYGPNNIGVFKGTLIQCINLNTLTKGTVDGHAIPANSGKIIIFEVSGTINAVQEPFIYKIRYPYTSIWGQTGPNDGVTLRNIKLSTDTNDIVVQHLRIRTGDNPVGYTPAYRDCIGITAGPNDTAENVVIDHCSLSWSIDELMEIYVNSSTGIVNNVTISNCICGEGLKYSIHDEGMHSKGIMISSAGYPGPTNIAIIRNLISSCTDRTPKICNSTKVVVANNILYNNEWFNVWFGPHNQTTDTSVINNAGIGGPSGKKFVKDYALTIWGDERYLHNEGIGSRIYLNGNRAGEYIGNTLRWNKIQSGPDDWATVDNRHDINLDVLKVLTPPISIPNAAYLNSGDLLSQLPSTIGCRPAYRDSVDTRLIYELESGTGSIVDCVESSTCPRSAGGWPVLAENRITLDIPANPHQDSGDGYTNLEIWLHRLAAEVEGISDPCAGVDCPDICIGDDRWSQKCVDGVCVADQLIEINSSVCGYDPCTGVFCPNTCVGPDLWSQRCDTATGLCITDQLLEINSDSCDGLCTGVDCPNTCIGPNLWSQRCDPATGHCITDKLLQEDSLNCTISDASPTDNSNIATYLVIGGLGLTGLAMLLLSRNKGGT